MTRFVPASPLRPKILNEKIDDPIKRLSIARKSSLTALGARLSCNKRSLKGKYRRRLNRLMLKIIIVASGTAYHHAAALTASTYAVHLPPPGLVSVLLPDNEESSPLLRHCSKDFDFAIEQFPFTLKDRTKFTSQLKCQTFAWQIARLGADEIVLFADADTCCLKPIELPISAANEIQSGRVGLVPDIKDRHYLDPSGPWYLAPEERSVYVNSGVIFASKEARGFFERVQRLSDEPRFLTGPLNDQEVINYALGKHFPGLLVPLDKRFNTIGRICEETVIAHFAGGAGFLAQQWRRHDHEQLCMTVLKD